MPETGGTLSRRDFLKLAGAAVGSAVLATVFKRDAREPGETLKQNELSIGALRVESIQGEDGLKRGIRILNQLETALQSTRLDLLITPEYSFSLNQGPEAKFEPRPLVIQQNGTEFTVDKLKSSGAAKIIVENAQSLAKDHKTNLFLSSFYDPSNPISRTTALFINSRGEITGVKRKGLPPDGRFEIQRGGQTLKILPLICGEAWEKTEQDSSGGGFKAIPPEWVAKNAPYDILVHSIAQGDLDFDKLAAIAQKSEIPNDSRLTNNEQWQRDTFHSYYDEYLHFLRPNAPMLISDLGMAACLNQDLSPISKYYDIDKFVVAKFDVSQQNQPQK